MRIKIIKGGIYGQPTKENPSGELAVGTELTVSKAPAGWAGRYVDLDADTPAAGEDVEALKARIAELEGAVTERDEQIAKLKPSGGTGAYTVKEQSAGWFAVVDAEGKSVTKNLRKADLAEFDGMTDADKAAFIDLNKAD